MGQGIHTKIARIAADTLGIDIGLIQVGTTDTADIPNAVSTGSLHRPLISMEARS